MNTKIKSFLLTTALLILLPGGLYAKSNTYAVIPLRGSVNPIMSEFISTSIKDANKAGVQFIVLQLDTPGGLMGSMRDIIQAIMTSKAPVVVYTYPKGAQAASAGGFIMLSAHIAAMAPGTEIGAMHPVSPMLDFLKRDKKGAPAGIMEKKVLNDTVAYARSLAQKRGRNAAWATRAVKSVISSTYREALKAGVIDLVASDMPDLLRKLNNRRVNEEGKIIVLHTRGAVLKEYAMDWKQKILNNLADPQIIMLLFIIGVIGIAFEFKNPGMIVPGAVGGIAFFLFLMAVRVLPINVVGLLLIVLAIVLFVLELKIVSYGLLTAGGIASFILGAMVLFDSPLPGGYIPMSTIIASVIAILAFVFIVVRAVIDVHRTQVATGREGLVGEQGEALNDFTGRGGKVMVHGEIWNAVSTEPVVKGDDVEVIELRGMKCIVKRMMAE